MGDMAVGVRYRTENETENADSGQHWILSAFGTCCGLAARALGESLLKLQQDVERLAQGGGNWCIRAVSQD